MVVRLETNGFNQGATREVFAHPFIARIIGNLSGLSGQGKLTLKPLVFGTDHKLSSSPAGGKARVIRFYPGTPLYVVIGILHDQKATVNLDRVTVANLKSFFQRIFHEKKVPDNISGITVNPAAVIPPPVMPAEIKSKGPCHKIAERIMQDVPAGTKSLVIDLEFEEGGCDWGLKLGESKLSGFKRTWDIPARKLKEQGVYQIKINKPTLEKVDNLLEAIVRVDRVSELNKEGIEIFKYRRLSSQQLSNLSSPGTLFKVVSERDYLNLRPVIEELQRRSREAKFSLAFELEKMISFPGEKIGSAGYTGADIEKLRYLFKEVILRSAQNQYLICQLILKSCGPLSADFKEIAGQIFDSRLEAGLAYKMLLTYLYFKGPMNIRLSVAELAEIFGIELEKMDPYLEILKEEKLIQTDLAKGKYFKPRTEESNEGRIAINDVSFLRLVADCKLLVYHEIAYSLEKSAEFLGKQCRFEFAGCLTRAVCSLMDSAAELPDYLPKLLSQFLALLDNVLRVDQDERGFIKLTALKLFCQLKAKLPGLEVAPARLKQYYLEILKSGRADELDLKILKYLFEDENTTPEEISSRLRENPYLPELLLDFGRRLLVSVVPPDEYIWLYQELTPLTPQQILAWLEIRAAAYNYLEDLAPIFAAEKYLSYQILALCLAAGEFLKLQKSPKSMICELFNLTPADLHRHLTELADQRLVYSPSLVEDDYPKPRITFGEFLETLKYLMVTTD